MILKKKPYQLVVCSFLGCFIMPVYLQAKTTVSYADNSKEASQNKSDVNDISTSSEAQGDSISLPKINKVQFAGNASISSEVLQKAIVIKVNDVANQELIMDSMIKIAQLYKEKNIKITIDPILEKNSINSRNILFKIHEMPMSEK